MSSPELEVLPSGKDAFLFTNKELQKLLERIDLATVPSQKGTKFLTLGLKKAPEKKTTDILKFVMDEKVRWVDVLDEVLQLCKEHPDQAICASSVGANLTNAKLTKGMTPLHWSFVYGAPDHIIKALIKAYPEAVAARDCEYGLPVHMASYFGSTERTIRTLLVLYPGSVHARCRMVTPRYWTKMPGNFAFWSGERKAVRTALDIGNSVWMDKRIEIVEMEFPKEEIITFYSKLMESDARNINVKLEELVLLLEDVHQTKFFYTLVSAYFKLGAFNQEERAYYITRALDRVKQTTSTVQSLAIFKTILDQASKDGLIGRMDYHAFEANATLVLMENASFIQDMQEAVRRNTASIKGLEADVTAITSAVTNLYSAMHKKKKIETGLNFVCLTLNVVSMGVGGSAVTLLKDVVDFTTVKVSERLAARLGGAYEDGVGFLKENLGKRDPKETVVEGDILVEVLGIANYQMALPSIEDGPGDGSQGGFDRFLARTSLTQFGDTFKEYGYDRVELLEKMSAEELEQLANDVGLKAGHKMKLKMYLR